MNQLNYDFIQSRIEREAAKKFVSQFSRRDFLKMAGMTAGMFTFLPTVQAHQPLAPLASRARQASNVAFPNGIASGDTTQDSTVLWARSGAAGELTFEVGTDLSAPSQTLTAMIDDPMVPAKVTVEGLEPNTEYQYRVTSPDATVLEGRFKTAAAAGASVGLRFGVSGDWRGELRPYSAISNVAEKNLDFFVLHGDTVYVDIPSIDLEAEQARSIEEFRIKHNEVYSERFGVNYWADIRANTSVMATIDDHEVTNDFAGGASPETDERFQQTDVEFINQTDMYRNGLQVFQEYNPVRDEFYATPDDPRMDGRHKLYRYVTYGDDAAVFVIDARSFRDASVESTDDIFNSEAVSTYLESLFTPDRTMVGSQQLEDLKRDLMAAQEAGITWKFMMIPEPIQQMGWFGGNDRWEGYANERTEMLQFIEDNNILNVVWIAADVHSTFINNLTYQTEAGGELLPTRQFEVTTGSVAFYPPTGQALVEGANEFGLVPNYEEYLEMSLAEQDAILEGLFNRFVLQLQSFDTLGLEDSPIDAELVTGSYILGHSFGWTEFEVEAETQVLTITTYGIRAYDPATVANNSEEVLAQEPKVLSQLVVNPLSA